MEASAIEALVTASRQSAEMAQEAVKALKKMKEKGEKQEAEGFATASKVVKAPGLQGTKGMFNLYIYMWPFWADPEGHLFISCSLLGEK